jgi:hypothetical protein
MLQVVKIKMVVANKRTQQQFGISTCQIANDAHPSLDKKKTADLSLPD